MKKEAPALLPVFFIGLTLLSIDTERAFAEENKNKVLPTEILQRIHVHSGDQDRQEMEKAVPHLKGIADKKWHKDASKRVRENEMNRQRPYHSKIVENGKESASGVAKEGVNAEIKYHNASRRYPDFDRRSNMSPSRVNKSEKLPRIFSRAIKLSPEVIKERTDFTRKMTPRDAD
jgi:hypothetical protein